MAEEQEVEVERIARLEEADLASRLEHIGAGRGGEAAEERRGLALDQRFEEPGVETGPAQPAARALLPGPSVQIDARSA